MSQLNKTQTISEARVEFSRNLDKEGITPITRDGRFSAVLISAGQTDEQTADRLYDLLQRNPKAGVKVVRRIAVGEQ
jgi:PHD/YefM family antitoxin component YafN of YafNO toxin-antitoxin module